MAGTHCIEFAGRLLRAGGVVAYPTEGVFGLGCLARDEDAVLRVLRIKRRDVAQGLVVIVADPSQLGDWTRHDASGLSLPSSDERPLTWIVPAGEDAPPWILGRHDGLAVRQTTHPVARALCRAAGGPLVSTSANVSGRPPTRRRFVLRRQLGALVDYIVPGDVGVAAGPSEIRDMATGHVLRFA